MKKILIYPDKRLRVKTELIALLDIDAKKEINDLMGLLAKTDRGVGLAATQIGSKKRFLGFKALKAKTVDIFINPVISKSFGEKTFPKVTDKEKGESDFLEGCLSFPNYWGTAKRFLKIEVSWQEIVAGKLVDKKEVMTGFKAIVFQHEIDHLDGILFIDRIKESGGKFFKWTDEKMVDCSLADF